MTLPQACPSDNCPSCCEGPNRPHTTRSDGTSVVGAYRCPRCCETWTCSWRLETLERQEINHDVA